MELEKDVTTKNGKPSPKDLAAPLDVLRPETSTQTGKLDSLDTQADNSQLSLMDLSWSFCHLKQKGTKIPQGTESVSALSFPDSVREAPGGGRVEL